MVLPEGTEPEAEAGLDDATKFSSEMGQAILGNFENLHGGGTTTLEIARNFIINTKAT